MQTQQTPQTSIAFSGNIPKFYDSFLGPMFFEPYALDMANRISKLAPKRVLELASGTGRLTKLLPTVASKDAEIIASDINPAMVKLGSSIVQNDNIKWMEVDAVSLPFADATFDCIVVQFGVMFYSDKVKAYKEAWRVLKPGGTFIFNCWDEASKNPMAKLAHESLLHFFPVDAPSFYKIPFSYFDEKKIINDLNESGFKNPKIESAKLTGYSKSAADAANGLLRGTPTVTAIEDRDAEKLPLILDYLEKSIVDLFGKESLQVPLQALVVSCTK